MSPDDGWEGLFAARLTARSDATSPPTYSVEEVVADPNSPGDHLTIAGGRRGTAYELNGATLDADGRVVWVRYHSTRGGAPVWQFAHPKSAGDGPPSTFVLDLDAPSFKRTWVDDAPGPAAWADEATPTRVLFNGTGFAPNGEIAGRYDPATNTYVPVRFTAVELQRRPSYNGDAYACPEPQADYAAPGDPGCGTVEITSAIGLQPLAAGSKVFAGSLSSQYKAGRWTNTWQQNPDNGQPELVAGYDGDSYCHNFIFQKSADTKPPGETTKWPVETIDGAEWLVIEVFAGRYRLWMPCKGFISGSGGVILPSEAEVGFPLQEVQYAAFAGGYVLYAYDARSRGPNPHLHPDYYGYQGDITAWPGTGIYVSATQYADEGACTVGLDLRTFNWWGTFWTGLTVSSSRGFDEFDASTASHWTRWGFYITGIGWAYTAAEGTRFFVHHGWANSPSRALLSFGDTGTLFDGSTVSGGIVTSGAGSFYTGTVP